MLRVCRLANCVLYVAIYAALHLAFRDAIFPTYWYMGFKWDPSVSGTIGGGVVAAALGFALPPRGEDFRSFMLHVFALFPLVPMAVLFGTSNASTELFAWTLLGAVIVLMVSRLKLATSVATRLSLPLGMAMLAAIAIISVVLAYRATGALSFDLSMQTIYAHRAQHAEALSGMVEYAHMTATRTVVPLLMLAALVHRWWSFVILGVALELLIFGATQHRTALFAPFAIVLAYWLARRSANAQLLLLGYLAAILVGWLWSTTALGLLVNEFIVRRVMFIPAMLNYEYHDLVAANQLVLWSDSKLSMGLLEYPYAQSFPYLIGAQIGLPGAHANTGWVGSGYMHAGPAGLLLYALIIGLSLALLNDRAVERRDRFGAMAFFVLFLWVFISSDLPSVMLTHGMLIGIILFHLLGKLRRTETALPPLEAVPCNTR